MHAHTQINKMADNLGTQIQRNKAQRNNTSTHPRGDTKDFNSR